MTQVADHQQSRKAARRARVKTKRRAERTSLRTMITMSAAIGLFATSALPSYGFDPETTALSGLARDTNMQVSGQTLQLALFDSESVDFTRGEFSEAEASEFQVTRPRSRVYNGPLAEDYWVKPRFTAVTSGNIMKATAELVGTPYVFGGETPAGLDCSGLVLFVYSQFGIQLPHSVYQQAKLAKRIPISEAVPGDIVVFNDYSHNGIYAGNGNYYHAPQPGDRVKLAPIGITRFHMVRLVDIVG